MAGRANGVTTDGRFAYVTVAGAGLEIIDLEDIRAPRLIGSFAAAFLRDVSVHHGHAYVVGPRWGLGVVDISEPTTPVLRARLENYAAHKVRALGDRLHLVTDRGILVLDISAPGPSRELFLYETPYAVDVAIRGEYAFVVDSANLKAVHILVPEWMR